MKSPFSNDAQAETKKAGSKEPMFGDGSSFFMYAKSNPSPILVTDSSGEILYVNTAWEHQTGYTSKEVLGKNPRLLSSGKTPPEVHKRLWESLKAGRSFESDKIIDRRKDGSEYSVRSVFFPIKISAEIVYFIQVIHDITVQKGIDKRKDEFISIASHELRTPLQVILLSLDLLGYELKDAPAATIGILETLRNETNRLAELLKDLLDTSKLLSGKVVPEKESHDLEQLVRQVAEELGTEYMTHTITVEKLTDIPLIAYDSMQIRQVLTNLISNAVKYSPHADRVIVSLNSDENEVTVHVHDFGVGIKKEEQEKIFDMFYRVKTSSDIEGTGLGLSIATQIIAAHNGRFWVTSELGEGSTFHFSLPLKK